MMALTTVVNGPSIADEKNEDAKRNYIVDRANT